VPSTIAAVIQSAISLVEGWFVGGLGLVPLAGIALVFPLFMLVQMFSAGAMGGAVMGATARAIGAGDMRAANGVLNSALAISVVASVVLAGLFLGFAEPFFRLLGGEDGVLDAALAYARVFFPGIILIWLFNMMVSVLRGTGDMTRPAVAMIIVAVTHFLFIWLLLRGTPFSAPMGIEGAAWAVLLAYATSLMYVVWTLTRSRRAVRIGGEGGITRLILLPLLRAGSLASNQSLVTVIYALIATAIVGRLGTEWLAGYGIGVRLEFLMIPVIFGIGSALIAIVGAHVGAGERAKAIAIAWRGAFYAFAIVGVIGIIVAMFPGLWSGLFTDDPQVAAVTARYLSIVGPCYGFFAIGLCLYFASQGLNTLLYPVLGAVLRLVIVAVGAVFITWAGLPADTALFILIAAAMVSYGTMVAVSLKYGPWKS